MRRCCVLVLAMLVIGLTVFSVSGASSGAPSCTPAVAAPSQATVVDALATEAGMRYRQSQPHHWRECLLQR